MESPRKMTRRTLVGGVLGAMAAGSSSVEARQLTETEAEHANEIRQPIREILEEVHRVLSHIETGEIREYCRVIRNVLNKAYSEERFHQGRNLMNLFVENPIDGHPTQVIKRAEQAVIDAQRYLRVEEMALRYKGLAREVEDLNKKLIEARQRAKAAYSGK